MGISVIDGSHCSAYQPTNELPSNRSSVNKNTPHSGTNTAVEFYTVRTRITVPTKKDHRARITATAPVVTYCNAYRQDIKLQCLVIFYSSTGINRPFQTSSLTCNRLRICPRECAQPRIKRSRRCIGKKGHVMPPLLTLLPLKALNYWRFVTAK